MIRLTPGANRVSATSSRESLPESISISPEEVRAELARVLESELFAHSARLSRFLQRTVEAVLDGKADSVKEFALGQDVFERGADYDPRIDSIVRVEALRLRRKLNEYYERAGGEDPVIISYQPGSYVPRFHRRRPLEPPSESAPKDLDPDTIAVLPFVNLSADPEQAMFCTGTTEEIILELASVPGLKVLGLATVFALRDHGNGFLPMCRKLGVGTLVEGSVRRSGDQLRIGARTVDVATGQTAWSRSFERTDNDIFAIQDEIAQEVAAALQAPARPVPAIPTGAAGLEAYTWYLRGMDAWDEGKPERCREAIDHLKRAAALAPQFALPQSGLAQAYQWMALWGWAHPLEMEDQSRTAVQEAMRMDGQSAETQAAWATHLVRFEWNWRSAESAANRALELNPSCGLAYSMKANSALAQLRLDDALRYFERAVQLDPLSYRTNGAVGIAYWSQRRYDEAERWFRVAQSLKPHSLQNHYFRSRLYLSMGRWAEAVEQSLAASEESNLALGALGAAYAGLGNREKADEALRRLRERAEFRYVDGMASALVQMALDDTHAALESVAEAVENHSPMAPFLNPDHWFEPLRQDLRFQTILGALKLG